MTPKKLAHKSSTIVCPKISDSCPGLGGTGRASKSLRRSTAAPEEGWFGGDVGQVVWWGGITLDFPMISAQPICRFPQGFESSLKCMDSPGFFDKSQAEDALASISPIEKHLVET